MDTASTTSTLGGDDTKLSLDLNDYEKVISLDYGTSKCKAGYRIVQKGTLSNPERIHLLHLQDSPKLQIPQIVGFIRQGGGWKLLWGAKLDTLIRSRDKPAEDNIRVFDRLKMAFHEYDGAEKIKAHIEETLNDMGMQHPTVEWLLTESLHHVKEAIDQAIEDDIRYGTERFGEWTVDQVRQMAERALIGVPEVSSVKQNRSLQQIAKNAGFRCVQLVSEAEASLVYCALRLRDRRRLFRPLKHGEEVTSIDAGGMSHNVASFRNSGHVESGPYLELEYTGRHAGGTSGSEALGLKLVAHAKSFFDSTEEGGYEGMIDELGCGSQHFESRLLKGLDSFKRIFEEEEDAVHWMNIKGNAPLKEQAFPIKSKDLYKWLDECFDNHIAAIESIGTEQLKVIVADGGFYSNSYLRRRLEEYCKNHGIHLEYNGVDHFGSYDLDFNCSVVRGMHAVSTLRSVDEPCPYGFGVNIDEVYSPEQHADVQHHPHRLRRRIHRPGYYVADRWCTLLQPGTPMNPQEAFVADFADQENFRNWQIYFLRDEDGERHLDKEVYCTQRSIPESVDIYADEAGCDQDEPGHDIEELGSCISTEISSEELRRYRSVIHEGTKVYCVWSRISVRVQGRNTSILWDRAAPTFREGAEGRFKPPKEDAIIRMTESTIHNTDYSPFIRRKRYKQLEGVASPASPRDTFTPVNATLPQDQTARAARRLGLRAEALMNVIQGGDEDTEGDQDPTADLEASDGDDSEDELASQTYVSELCSTRSRGGDSNSDTTNSAASRKRFRSKGKLPVPHRRKK